MYVHVHVAISQKKASQLNRKFFFLQARMLASFVSSSLIFVMTLYHICSFMQSYTKLFHARQSRYDVDYIQMGKVSAWKLFQLQLFN